MIHPSSQLTYIDDAIGYGLIATEVIPKGTITWVCDPLDQVIPDSVFRKAPPLLREKLDKYTYFNGRGERILCWDHARFVNHSCVPTCLSPGFDFEIAVRDIQPGEQITDDYGTLNLLDSFICRCKSEQCRGEVRPDDMVRLWEEWDLLIKAAFPLVGKVPQALWGILPEREEVEKILAGVQALPSCRVNFAGWHEHPNHRIPA